MKAFELAQKYYPDLWSIERIDMLLAAGKLTAEEYKKITSKANKAGKEQQL